MIRSAIPREALLRPIGEWYVVFTCLCAATLCLIAYEYLFMTRSIAFFSCGVFTFLAALYLKDGLHLRTYQKNIRRLRHFEIDPDKVVFNPNYVNLGKGFRWLPIHTQRLRDTFRDYNKKYIVDSGAYTNVRNFCLRHKGNKKLRYLLKLLNWNSPFNYFRPLPPVGGYPAIHGIEPNEKDILWDWDERVGHTGIIGATRVGKTRLAELLISHDIRAGAKKIRDAENDGNVVVIIDPKGDGELLRRCIIECIAAGRLDDFYMFHLGFPELSCLYNPIADYQNITEVAGRSTNQLADGGSSAAFKEFSWRFVNIIAQAIEAINEEVSYEKLAHYIVNTDEILSKYLDVMMRKDDPDWSQTVDQLASGINDQMASKRGRSKDVLALVDYAKDIMETTRDPIIRGLVSALDYDKTYYDKLVASLIPFLDKMTTGSRKDILSPIGEKKGKKRIRWRDVISRRGVVYVGLDALSDPTVAVAVASAMLSDLASVAGDIYKNGTSFDEPEFGNKKSKIPILLHLDEFNELITGDEIIQILNKAGGAGMLAHVYTQTIKDIEAKIGSSAKAAQIIGNLQNIIMMRVRETDTARLLTDQLPNVEVSSVTEVGGTRDDGSLTQFSTDNSDRSTSKEQPMLEVSDITGLSKGQAFVYKNGGELFKVRFPMFKKDKIELSTDVNEMIAQMKAKYKTSDGWADRLNGK